MNLLGLSLDVFNVLTGERSKMDVLDEVEAVKDVLKDLLDLFSNA